MGEWESMLLTDKDYMSVRISYKLNLKGPSFIMHSSCSTSLVAVHLGCRALLTGECDMALVGGVSISASRVSGYIYQEGMILSRDGHCRPFDAQASGTIGGEGIGIAVLKRLDDAAAAGDNIYAVVKGSAINNDGKRKIGFSAPSIDGQVESIRSTLHLSRIEPERIGYVEAHGTGTNLGDPVEIEALKMAFNTKKKGYCSIGSVKSNIGHLDVAAGIAGFIKTVLVLKHKLIPPSLHFHDPNPAIDFDNSPFYVNKELREWKNDEYPLSAGVSSFGIGGTNIHVILEEAPAVFPDGASPSTGAGDYRLLLLSAGSQTALDKMTGHWVDYLRSNPGIDFADAAYTLQVGRKTFNHRKMTVCRGTAEAVDLLSSHGAGKVHTNVLMKENPPVIFMFPGQGAQYVNMGLELYKTEALFRQELDRCFDILKPLVNRDIKAVLYPGESTLEGINQTEITQPVIFAFEYALAKLLMAWGVNPYAMIGHSIGEYTAACLAGVFSLEDALHLVVWRGKLMQEVPSGAMLGVPLPEEELLPFLNEHISLAAVNSSSHCVVSGTHQAMDAFAADMKKRGYETSRLHTSHAFHSAMMDPVLEEFEAQVRNITFNKPEIPYISNVSGEWLTPDDGNNPGYWKRHLRETVRFSRGLEELLKEEHAVFIEVGPGKVLSTFIRQHNGKGDGHHTVHLIRHPKEDISDRYRLFNALGQIWLYGGRIDWEGFYTHEKRRRVSLPTYPFEGQRYWIDADFSKAGALTPSQGTAVSKREDISDWFYLPTWRRDLPPAASKKKGASPGKRLWLVLMDDHGAGKELVKRLENDGEDVIWVDAGKEFQKAGDRGYIIDACRPGDYHALFKDLKDSGKVPGTIIHLFLLSLTGEHETVIDAESLESNVDKGFHSLIYLTQAIEKQDITGKIRIEIVTNNMQDVTGEENLNPAKSILLGACKTIPQEYPNIRCRSIDIVFTGSGSLAEGHLLDRLITEFKSDSTGALVAYRNNRRWVQVFEPLQLEKKEEDNPRLRPKGVYLVTGGLGRIGLILSGYLAEKVKAKLILVSRSDFPPRDQWDQWLKDYGEENKQGRAIKKIKDFERSGAEVLVFSADVSDENRMREVIDRAEEQLGPLNGVIHLQFQPKISGLLVLHKVLQDKNLDFCLLTSSTAAILGGLTFTAYSAANIFMDAFAAWHNKLNPSQPWISVNWDGWREEGDKTAFEPAMTPGEGIEAFERILSYEGLTHVITSTGDLHAGIRVWINLESLQEEEDIPGEEPSTTLYSRPNLTNTYVPPNTRVEADLCEIWQRVFGFSQVGIHDNFFELGGDSLKAINVSAKIHKTLNVKIPMDEFFNRQTIAELAGYIAISKETEFFSIDPAEEKEYYELPASQKGLYILQQLDEKSIGYNMAGIVKLDGFFNKERLEQAFKKLIKRHESLRTAFVVAGREPV
jgi:acyl transferase domain-containing protein